MVKRLLTATCVAVLAFAPAIALAQQATPIVQAGGAAGTQVAQGASTGAMSSTMLTVGGLAVAGALTAFAVDALSSTGSTATTGTCPTSNPC